jgi:hypothetical protein
MDEGVEMPGLFGGHDLRHVETLYLAGNARGKRRGIEARHGPYARLSGKDSSPSRGDLIAHWADKSNSGDHNASTHGLLS